MGSNISIDRCGALGKVAAGSLDELNSECHKRIENFFYGRGGGGGINIIKGGVGG